MKEIILCFSLIVLISGCTQNNSTGNTVLLSNERSLNVSVTSELEIGNNLLLQYDNLINSINSNVNDRNLYFSEIQNYINWVDSNRGTLLKFKSFIELNSEKVRDLDLNPDYIRDNIKTILQDIQINEPKFRQELLEFVLDDSVENSELNFSKYEYASFDWIKANTPGDSVFIDWWDYDYGIQTFAERRTVTDGPDGEPSIYYTIGRYLFGGLSLNEVYDALESLKNPDYFYVVSDDVGKFYQMERIGERDTYYTLNTVEKTDVNTLQGSNSTVYPNMIIFKPTTNAIAVQEDFTVNGKLFAKSETYVLNIFVPYNANGNIGTPLAGVYNTQYGQALVPINGFCEEMKGCFDVTVGGVPAYFYLIRNGAIWVPEKASQMFMTQQYLLNKSIPGFELVWESSAPLTDMRTIVNDSMNVRIYKIDYSEIQQAISDDYFW